MAQEIANLIGGITPDELMRLRPQEQVLLMESKLIRCLQVRHYEDQLFRRAA
jgi:type IV secretory pathway TraG/TraD family ATPase VirD4